jgi:uncharacterized phiE125 gp8 family phage protein
MSIRQTIHLHQHRGNRILTEPTVEPVTLNELKEHMRLDGSGDDIYLLDLLAEARQMIEDHIGMAMLTQSWTLTLDSWPHGQERWWDGVRQGHINSIYAAPHLVDVELPKYPLQSITSVTVYDEDGTSSAVTVADVFDIDTQQMPGRITLQRGAVWPIAMRANNAIEIIYISGYGSSASDVPAPLKRAVKQLAAYLYAHRGDGCDMGQAMSQSGVISILNTYKAHEI